MPLNRNIESQNDRERILKHASFISLFQQIIFNKKFMKQTIIEIWTRNDDDRLNITVKVLILSF